jgi:hypothetical protein
MKPTDQKCAQEISSENLDKLADTEPCHADETSDEADCLSFWTDDDLLLIVRYKYVSGTYQVIHVKVEQLVTIADERED